MEVERDEETEYELLRQRNIEENMRMLASLGLEKGTTGAESVLLPTTPNGRVKPKPAKRRFSAEESRPTPVRASRRLQGLAPIASGRRRGASEGDKLDLDEPDRRKAIKRGPVEMKSHFLSPEEQEAFMKTFKSASLARRASVNQIRLHTEDFKKTVSSLHIPSWSYIQKVTKDRIYSLAWHPYISADGRAIVCVGDKWGQLGMWALPVPGYSSSDTSSELEHPPGRTSDSEEDKVPIRPKRIAKRRNRAAQPIKTEEVKQEEEDVVEKAPEEYEVKVDTLKEESIAKDESDEERQTVSVYQPHSRVISGIVFSPTDCNKLYTTSFDGTIRCMDAEKNAFELVYTDDGNSREVLLTRLDVSSSGRELYFVNSAGQMKMRDLRASEKKVVESYQLHEKKAYCVHINKSDESKIATSSGDGTVCVWDVRKLDEEGSESLHTFQHRQSIASAFFSPLTGEKILSTSYDNTIRVWDVSDSGASKKKKKKPSKSNSEGVDPLYSINHNNQTGRWLTPFQATWHPFSEEVVVVGDMKRAVDIIGTNTDPVWWERLEDEKMGTIPSLNAFHPTLHPKSLLASANASGRVFVWTEPA